MTGMASALRGLGRFHSWSFSVQVIKFGNVFSLQNDARA